MPLRRRSPETLALPPEPAGPRPGETLCGYRLVRKLGDGARAEVFLGFSTSTADSAEPTTAAIKVARHGVAAESVLIELEALARIDHPHVVRLTDAATTPFGSPCLVLERLSRGSLAHLVERRSTFEAGEVVTILAPIATAVDALHESGVVHGGIGPRTVLFRDTGAPVLSRFGRARLIERRQPPAVLAKIEAVIDDRAALATLAATVLGRVEGSEASELAAWSLASARQDGFGAALADRLFALAEPRTVGFAADIGPVASAVPSRLGSGVVAESLARGVRERFARIRAGQLRAGRLGPLLASVGQVRKPIWVGATSVLIAIVAAIAAVPSEGSDTAGASPGVSEDGRGQKEDEQDPIERIEEVDDALSDDPVAALASLLELRGDCLEQLSVLCLDAVDHHGSAALDDDVALLRSVQEGGELPSGQRIAAPGAVLVERLGDSALLDLGVGRDRNEENVGQNEPASVLIIRTEAGWRIRDYLD